MAYIFIKDSKRLEQLSLTGITEESLTLIHEHKDVLISLVTPVVEDLYTIVYQIQHLQETIDQSSSLEKVIQSQIKYLQSTFSPIIDDEYIKERYNIGFVHSKVGLRLPWFLSTYRKSCQIIYEHLSKELPRDIALPLMDAIDSLLNFDTQIIVDAYNELEIDKATFPLRYEFRDLQKKSGLTKEDFDSLDNFHGLFTFHLEEILIEYEQSLIEREVFSKGNKQFIHSSIPYLGIFLKQFFQEKLYRDEASYYRVIRDWITKLNDKNVTEQDLISMVNTLNEVTRKVFIRKIETEKSEQYNLSMTTWLHAFERYTRFTLAIIQELMHPYRYVDIYHFLDIFSYEISIIDFGKITWLDDHAKNLLKKRGLKKEDIANKRCYEVFYDRVLPCSGCPAREMKQDAIITTRENDGIPSYYKTWRLPQSRLSELTHRLLVGQDISKDTKVTFDTIESLLHLAEYRDDDTGEHVNRIGIFAAKLAEITGCNESFIREIQVAAKFHDIGKVGIPDSILNKPAKLSKEEWESMKTHVNIGHQILTNLDFPIIQMAARIAETHHEHWDGNGYPNQLKRTEIPLEGRIVAIVDVFDALMSKRSYKKAFPPEQVKQIIEENKGTHFDPDLTDFFLSAWDEFVELYYQCTKTEHPQSYV